MTAQEPHLGDQLSALVDGELDADAAASARAHVQTCGACAAELEDTRAGRRAIRLLPAVEPPPGFLAGLVAAGGEPGHTEEDAPPAPIVPLRRRRAAQLASAAAAAAAVAVFLAGGEVPADDVQPQVGGVVAAHAATMEAATVAPATGAPGATDTTAPAVATDRLPEPYRAPAELAGGYRLVRAARAEDGLQLFYRRDEFGLSVFEREGAPDWASLPEAGRRVEANGEVAWELTTADGEGTVVVFTRDGMTFTAVGDEPGDAVRRAAVSMPGPRPQSFGTRLVRACGDALETFSPLP